MTLWVEVAALKTVVVVPPAPADVTVVVVRGAVTVVVVPGAVTVDTVVVVLKDTTPAVVVEVWVTVTAYVGKAQLTS